MSPTHMGENDDTAELSRELVDELLRTSLILSDMFCSLAEAIPEGGFPGEDEGAVLLEMFAGSCVPVVAAAGESSSRTTIALIVAVRERLLADLKAAAAQARDRRRP